MNAFEVWTEPRPVKLTAESFWQLAESGAFRDQGKTELIDGVVVAMSPQHSRHSFLQGEFHVRLALALRALRPDLRTAVEGSIAISPENVPQADILASSYRGSPASIPAASVPLVIEVAETTARYDRGTKARIYAQGGIPEYWVVDIRAGEVARFWQPGPDGYGRHDAIALGEPVGSVTLPGLTVQTDAL